MQEELQLQYSRCRRTGSFDMSEIC
jgi:hypothetical protein